MSKENTINGYGYGVDSAGRPYTAEQFNEVGGCSYPGKSKDIEAGKYLPTASQVAVDEVNRAEKDIQNGKYTLKDSGDRREFPSGAVRDRAENKPRFELIPPLALKRVAHLYAAGAKKYSNDNWALGMPFRDIYASLLRHVMAYGEGDDSEDHLASAVFNALAIMHFQEMGRVDLDDMPKWLKKKEQLDDPTF